jgi:hypothetical protein
MTPLLIGISLIREAILKPLELTCCSLQVLTVQTYGLHHRRRYVACSTYTSSVSNSLYERQNKGSTFYPKPKLLQSQLPPEELTGGKDPVNSRARAPLTRHFEISVDLGAIIRHNRHALKY